MNTIHQPHQGLANALNEAIEKSDTKTFRKLSSHIELLKAIEAGDIERAKAMVAAAKFSQITIFDVDVGAPSPSALAEYCGYPELAEFLYQKEEEWKAGKKS